MNLTSDFTRFLELSLGFRADKPLPGPASVANQLRQRSLEVIEDWNDKFGGAYKQVSTCVNVEFAQVTALSVTVRQPSMVACFAYNSLSSIIQYHIQHACCALCTPSLQSLFLAPCTGMYLRS